jgi:putative restriction endonuclease
VADHDLELRAAAISHVAALESRYAVLSWDQIAQGFEFRGERVLLAGRARGIFKPTQLARGALSIKTVQPRAGREQRYDDQLASQAPYFIYRWQGPDPNATDNRNLRDCLRDNLPIIYFYAVDVALYQPIICHVVGEDPAARAFHVAPIAQAEVAGNRVLRVASLPIERRYGIAEVRRRLHQQKFRAAVIEAYDTRCGICRLHHAPLLDAAHIIPDAEPMGEARVSNGISMCRLHHAAFDCLLMGITPELVIHLNRELLTERDGPMLEHGLRAFEGQQVVVPGEPSDQPDRELLEVRWKRFAA